ncbi:hypothetical protein [Niveibacterium sp. SC-1]|uniref:hypothetical protein n=1 Tax=Niveibacterium sp. SC-1 TaxID=3135646 RepID=UPI00311DB118
MGSISLGVPVIFQCVQAARAAQGEITVDRFTVFCRTETGDRELNDPRTAADKMARSVLEAVDGFSTVGELCSRLGRNRAVQQALGELERNGLVETLDARMARVSEQESRWLRGDAGGGRMEPSGQLPAAAADGSANLSKAEEKRLRRAIASGSRATIMDRIRSFFGNLGHGAMTGGGKKAHKLRRVVAGVAVLLVLLVIGAAFVSLGYQVSNLREKVEREAAAWLGEPVKVGSVGIGFHPWPAFALQDIQIGEGGTTQVARAWGHPDWLHWALGQTQSLSVALDGIKTDPVLLQRVAALTTQGNGWRLKKIAVDNLAVGVGSLRLHELGGTLGFDEAGRWAEARLTGREGGFVYELSPQAGVVKVFVYNPQETDFGPSKLENLSVQGDLGPTGLTNVQISANWLSGSLKGNGTVDFAQSAALTGDFKLDSVSAAKLVALSDAAGSMDGRLSGSFRLDAKAAEPAEWASRAVVDGQFTVADGTLLKIDLFEAMRRPGGAPISGGTTRFGKLEGRMAREPGKPVRVDIRRLESGALTASGRITLAEQGQLGGMLRNEVRTPVESIVRQFSVQGTAAVPQLRALGE